MKKILLTAWIVLFAFAGGAHAQDKDSLTFVNAQWNTKQLADGVEWRYYHFKSAENLFGANEYINIIVIDQAKAKLRFKFASKVGEKVRTSDAARSAGAIAAINGCLYNTKPPYNSICFLKTDGKVLASPTEYGDYIIIDGNGRLRIQWANAVTLPEPEIMGCWPKLITGGKQCPIPQNDTREPRTAIGTEGEKVFLVTVDGRNRKNSEGMTIDELGRLFRWIGANDALSLDGGGSTTMYVRGESDKGIVNHPSDNFFGFSHSGERSVSNSILLLDNSTVSLK